MQENLKINVYWTPQDFIDRTLTVEIMEHKYSAEDVKRMLIEVGISSYFAGESDTTMKPSLVAEKYIYNNILTEEDKEKLNQFNDDGE